jgi:hypothetical protein
MRELLLLPKRIILPAVRHKNAISFYGIRSYSSNMYTNFCYLCNTEKLTRPCSTCGKPTCKECTKNFPFSNSVCLECASGVKTRLAGIRSDEEIF